MFRDDLVDRGDPLAFVGDVERCAMRALDCYGFFGAVYPSLMLHCILLPLNATRLYQMLQLVKKVKKMASTSSHRTSQVSLCARAQSMAQAAARAIQIRNSTR